MTYRHVQRVVDRLGTTDGRLLNRTDLLVLLLLAHYARGRTDGRGRINEAEVSGRDLCRGLLVPYDGTNGPMVSRSLSRLVKHGYITREVGRGGPGTVAYRLLPPLSESDKQNG